MIERSTVISVLVPESQRDPGVLYDALKVLEKTRVTQTELYTPFELAGEMAKVYEDSAVKCAVYPIAGVQKMEGYSLCDFSTIRRHVSIDLIRRAFDAARCLGARKVLITSGRFEGKEEEALKLLAESIEKLMEEADGLEVVLETGDRDVDAEQLLGATDLSVRFAEDIRSRHKNFYLTLDTSHLAQLGEEPSESVKKALHVSDHVHLATCILKQGHEYYGDRHPLFSHPDAVFGPGYLERIFSEVSSVTNRNILIGHEIIDRSGERLGSLEKAIKEAPWFF
ncbi:MAG: sugar phosphate isomerase/epimerase family protein [Bullifex sp.]